MRGEGTADVTQEPHDSCQRRGGLCSVAQRGGAGEGAAGAGVRKLEGAGTSFSGPGAALLERHRRGGAAVGGDATGRPPAMDGGRGGSGGGGASNTGAAFTGCVALSARSPTTSTLRMWCCHASAAGVRPHRLCSASQQCCTDRLRRGRTLGADEDAEPVKNVARICSIPACETSTNPLMPVSAGVGVDVFVYF